MRTNLLARVGGARCCFCGRFRAPTEAGEPVSTRLCLTNLQTDERQSSSESSGGRASGWSHHIWKTQQLRGRRERYIFQLPRFNAGAGALRGGARRQREAPRAFGSKQKRFRGTSSNKQHVFTGKGQGRTRRSETFRPAEWEKQTPEGKH